MRLSLLLLCFASLLSPKLLAQDGGIVMLAPHVSQKGNAAVARARAELVFFQEIAKQSGFSIRSVDEEAPRSCNDQCFASLAEKHKASYILAPSIALDSGIRLKVAMYNGPGELVTFGEVRSAGASRQIASEQTKALVMQVLLPGQHKGALVLSDLPTSAVVAVDGIRMSLAKARGKIPLYVGRHRVSVQHGGTEYQSEFDIDFEKTTKLDVDLSGEEKLATSVGYPAWPGWTLGAAGALLAVVSGGFALDALTNGTDSTRRDDAIFIAILGPTAVVSLAAAIPMIMVAE